MSFQKYKDILWKGKKALDARGDQLKNRDSFLEKLKQLQEAIIKKDRREARLLSKEVKQITSTELKKPFWLSSVELIGSLMIAFVLAILVRQMWFELYQIPTGSMRPTFKEQDHLTVTKTAFSLNVPLKSRHFWFDENLVERTAPVIWSGEGTLLPDVETTYFGFIPYHRRYIKRVMGKPGDHLYFYGGKVYGVDREGNEINELIDSPWMTSLEHIPVPSNAFSADVTPRKIVARLFQEPLMTQKMGFLGGSTYSWSDNKRDINDQAPWGIDNYAIVRILNPEQLQALTHKNPVESYGKADLYLEVNHHFRLPKGEPQLGRRGEEMVVLMEGERSYLPLKQEHIDALYDNLYTGRFKVKNEKAVSYGSDSFHNGIDLKGVPDGTYEFYYGKGSLVGKGSILYDLPKNHPLNQRSPQLLQTLVNLGIEWYPLFNPDLDGQGRLPSRYGYFREGDFYVMGGKIYSSDDKILKEFVERETSDTSPTYHPFIDQKPTLDKAFILKEGLVVPEKKYLLLGDNHANSLDSRVIGFIQEENLEGVPSLIIWPPGERLGVPSQKAYPFLSLPRIFIWIVVSILIGAWYLYKRRVTKLPIV